MSLKSYKDFEYNFSTLVSLLRYDAFRYKRKFYVDFIIGGKKYFYEFF